MSGEPWGKILRGKVVIVGVGNSLRGDDGLGPWLVGRLAKSCRQPCINAGDALERHLGRIVREKPDTVLLVDAAHLGCAPGDHALLDPGELEGAGFSTHRFPLQMQLEELARSVGCRVYLLAVQPRRLELGKKVCGQVRRSLQRLEKRISRALAAA
jgi:hydrogenase 3 maturation protease